MIFYKGFDVTKELLYGFIRQELADRGIACLVIDTPGTGEPLRLRGVPSHPDYEVPTSAIVDYLATRPTSTPNGSACWGISLGGHYAPLGAAFEHRVKASLRPHGPHPALGMAVRPHAPSGSEVDQARLIASSLAAAGMPISRRALGSGGVRGSNKALNALARILKAEIGDPATLP